MAGPASTVTVTATDPLPRWIRTLVPGGLAGGDPATRTARDRLIDAAMYLSAMALSASVLVDRWSEYSDGVLVADLAIGFACLVSLHWRRAHPSAIGLVSVVASIAVGAAAGPALIASFNAAIRAPRRSLAAIVALSIPACAVYPALYPGPEPYAFEVAFGVALTGVVLGWGLFVRARRELVHSLRERADRAEVEAREAERRRIAREMHDVLAHRLSIVSMHAGALEFRPDAPPAERAAAAGIVRESARAALEELREVIGVLREEAPASGPEPPQPTLADLPALVEDSRAAGMRVRSVLDIPDGRSESRAIERTAYRIVQEGLTNARKHAAGAAVDVSVSGTGDGLAVQVRSCAPVGASAGPDPDPRAGVLPDATRTLPGAGTGLIGLAERVSLAGGELEHGVDATDGAFVLRARLPR